MTPGSGAAKFAQGMCKLCFEDFIAGTGGMSEGADPPAYNAEVARSHLHHGPLHSFHLPPDSQVRPCIIPPPKLGL